MTAATNARAAAGVVTSLVRPAPAEGAREPRRFTRGRERPRGVVWFGLTSFWGHLRHLVASAIATEDVDSRDWMTPDAPAALVGMVARVLGARTRADTLVQALGRDVWIDYLADTGDDVAVSRAVARLVFAPYELPDPARPGQFLEAPRGDVLFFGGDTAYPVATANEIAARVIRPFNEVLASLPDDGPRVLLGIPGNHDWYDGLDGFGRMFRRRDEHHERESSPALAVERGLPHVAQWAREFVRGGHVEKPTALPLRGYVPLQSASHFVLPLTPRLHLFAVDRQLRYVDFRQERYFRSWLRDHPAATPWLVLPNPVLAFGQPSDTGEAMTSALGVDLDARPHLVLAGDLHHYARSQAGPSLHIVAGGGGAFLHPAPVARAGRRAPEREWPDARQSRALLGEVPWKVMLGRSGFLPHLCLLVLFLPAMGVGARIFERSGVFVPAPILTTLLATVVYALIGGVRKRGWSVAAMAFSAGLATAAVPLGASIGVHALARLTHVQESLAVAMAATLLVAVFGGALVFGFYLAALTWLGLEHTQAFTALDHPGYKHFVRLRVRADGTGVDAWVVGLVDPLAQDGEPVLVDQFTFRV